MMVINVNSPGHSKGIMGMLFESEGGSAEQGGKGKQPQAAMAVSDDGKVNSLGM